MDTQYQFSAVFIHLAVETGSVLDVKRWMLCEVVDFLSSRFGNLNPKRFSGRRSSAILALNKDNFRVGKIVEMKSRDARNMLRYSEIWAPVNAH